ncbi:MAG: PorT family protein [candidate division KSB1 bacterium]|nr:PorT family protein [candidate division KSB1 bacterium]MDZ7304313.1 PorT family protein [candidate division KSB1 bacterium]MDZ7313590.1 PorT family protein [candidate division KSB1 bacterium]
MYLKLMTALLLCCASLSQGQMLSGYGMKFGIVSSELKTEGGAILFPGGFILREDLKQRLGPQIGLFVDFFKIPHLGLQAEVSYLEKGAEEELPITTEDHPEGTGEFYTVDSYHFDYLAFSLLAQPKLKLGAVNPYVMVGPSLNLLIANRNGLYRDTKDLTPSLVLGAGVELLKPFAFPVLLEVRYNPDLDYFFESEYRKSELRVWQFMVGVNLH